uniref:Uncharacterized protein n=1 Tax=Anopheles culicifacies TaxID=139723 RepID=A0A182ME08_9DIPT
MGSTHTYSDFLFKAIVLRHCIHCTADSDSTADNLFPTRAMKLCLLIATAVAIATCYALPVPKEEVFAVYPVNSALEQHSSEVPVETKPEQVNSPAESASSKDLAEEKKVTAMETEDVKAVENKPEEMKSVPTLLKEQTSEEAAKTLSPAEEVKSAPLKESTDVKPEDTPVTVPPTDNVPTTVATKDETKLEVTQSVVAVEPKVAVPETLAVESKLVEKEEMALTEKSVKEEPKLEEKAKDAVATLVENVKVEDKKEEVEEVKKNEQTVAVEPQVKAEEKSVKLATEEPKPDSSQARSSSDLAMDQTKTEVKPEVEVAEQAVVKATPAAEPLEEKKPVVEETKVSSASVPEVTAVTDESVKQPTLTANDPEPQTEGKEEPKPTKVRAAPIVEGLKVSQPVEAEPAVTKIHVTVIQEEVELDNKNAAKVEVAMKDAAVTEGEESSTEAVTTTTSAMTEKEVKSDEMAVEKVLKEKDEMTSNNLGGVKNEDAKPEAVKTVDVSKEESSAQSSTTETVVVVVPDVKVDDVTTVVAVAENTDKPVEKVTEVLANSASGDKPVLEVRPVAQSADLPEPATTAKAEEQQAKAVEGSSQPGASERSDTVKEDAKDQSDSISTTVSSVTELDTTTVSPVTTTEPELVPTPAKQKAKKQVPLPSANRVPMIMKHSALVLLVVLLCSALVPRIQSAPQRSIDFLLGDEELQAVVKPIEENSPSTTIAQEQTVAYDDDEQSEVQATVDPIENEQQTEEPQRDLPTTEDYPEEEEELTEDPKEDPLDPVTDSPKQDEQNTTRSNDLTSLAPAATTTTTPSPKEVTTHAPKTSSTIDSVENNSSEEQLTTNPIVVPDNGDQSTTESSEDSNQLAQDVNDFIHDLANEVRSSATDKPRRPQPPKPSTPQYSTILPTMVPERYDSKSAESNEDDDQVQLKVDPNDTQTTNGPSLTEDQFRSLFEKLPWFGQQRFPGYDQWQHQGFPQRSSWQHRDDRQRHYQSHGSDSFQGHGFHRGSWH